MRAHGHQHGVSYKAHIVDLRSEGHDRKGNPPVGNLDLSPGTINKKTGNDRKKEERAGRKYVTLRTRCVGTEGYL